MRMPESAPRQRVGDVHRRTWVAATCSQGGGIQSGDGRDRLTNVGVQASQRELRCTSRGV
jgi:hypothetical protein